MIRWLGWGMGMGQHLRREHGDGFDAPRGYPVRSVDRLRLRRDPLACDALAAFVAS